MFAERLVPDERINDFLHAVVNELGLELFQYIWGETHESLDKAVESVSVFRLCSSSIDGLVFCLYIFQKVNEHLKELMAIATGGPIFGEGSPPPDCKPDSGNKVE